MGHKLHRLKRWDRGPGAEDFAECLKDTRQANHEMEELLREALADRRSTMTKLAEIEAENRLLRAKLLVKDERIGTPSPATLSPPKRVDEEIQANTGPAAKEISRIKRFVQDLKDEANEVRIL